jgi:hypothetical protein
MASRTPNENGATRSKAVTPFSFYLRMVGDEGVEPPTLAV